MRIIQCVKKILKSEGAKVISEGKTYGEIISKLNNYMKLVIYNIAENDYSHEILHLLKIAQMRNGNRRIFAPVTKRKADSTVYTNNKRSGHRYKSEEEIIRINGAIPQLQMRQTGTITVNAANSRAVAVAAKNVKQFRLTQTAVIR